jgi:uncharacterized metal-binding protein
MVLGAAAARASGRAGLAGLFERIMDERLDGRVTASALGAAAKATVDSTRRARARLALDGRTDVLIGKDIAGADDHKAT